MHSEMVNSRKTHGHGVERHLGSSFVDSGEKDDIGDDERYTQVEKHDRSVRFHCSVDNNTSINVL